MSSFNDNTNDNNIINEEVLDKKAKGVKEAEFGKIKEITLHYILAQRVENKDKFYLPRSLLKDFNKNELRFAITEHEANTKYKRDNPPSIEEYETLYKKNSNKLLKNKKKKQSNTKITDPKNISMNFNDRYKKEEGLIQYKQSNNANNQSKKMRKNVILEDNMNENKVKIGDTKIKNEKEIKNKEQIMQKIGPTTMIFAGEKSKQEAETSARREAETRAQEIKQEAETSARREAETRAQEIKQEAETSARREAETRAQEIKQEAETSARREAETRAQEIKQEAETSARREAETRAQEIKQEAETSARREAETRAQEIKQEAETSARREAETRAQEIKQEAETSARREAETTKQNYNINIVMKNNNEINNNIIETNHPEEYFDPFFTSIEIWQNYSMYWINKIKEIFQSTTDLTRNVEIAREKEFTNNAISQWFGTNTT